MAKKVFVSGSFDMLHSGHIAFLEEAATYGDLYVALGSDATIYELKGRLPVTHEAERLFSMQALRCVTKAFISSGSGMLDFEHELRQIKPDLFIVNEDGNVPHKAALCAQLGIDYLVLKRTPHTGLPARSTTQLRTITQMPYRIDIAGGWLDQPFVSEMYPGSVLTISLVPTIEFNERSGMATSTRNNALKLWGLKIPPGDPEHLADALFRYDNPPGKLPISGAQDAIGIVFSGLARSDYAGEYWPSHIEHVLDEPTLQFIEQALYLIPLGPRESGYDPLDRREITAERAKALADAAADCWTAALAHDLPGFGDAIRRSFEAQVSMFPDMMNDLIEEFIQRYSHAALGWKLSGAGGGGYLILVADQPIENAVRISIRREWE